MSRVDVIAGAISRFCADMDPELFDTEAFARYIDDHLGPETTVSEHPSVLTLRMVKAVVDEALRPQVRLSPSRLVIKPPKPRNLPS